MPRDTSPGTLRTDFRPRRSHEKSRNGCIRCKQQRKKCDEAKPACGRCTKHNYCCRYQRSTSESRAVDEPNVANTLRPESVDSPPSIVLSTSSPSFARSDGLLSVDSSSPNSLSSFHTGLDGDDELHHQHHKTLQQTAAPSVLNAAELGLLSHYLSCASRSVAFDDDDLYALSVGIPNIAFGNGPVMSSMIALAAASKCNEMTTQGSSSLLNNLGDARGLLLLADRHHRGSLEQIQTTISSSDSYDGILANAALMVLYSSANHCVRIRLAESARQNGIELPSELLPQGSQWISLIRAAHTASTGVLKNLADVSYQMFASGVTHPMTLGTPESTTQSSGKAQTVSPEDGPSEGTKMLFLPIVLSSHNRALERLSARVHQMAASSQLQQSPAWQQEELQACLNALPQLNNAVMASMSAGDPSSQPSFDDSAVDESIPFDLLPKVSPWLGRYLARVTSLTSPRPLRRTVMSFLNKAPIQFLILVQSVLDTMPLETNNINNMEYDCSPSQIPILTETQFLAMDIFAHWLVFVMLLDGVWWIGGIGQWELEHVVTMMRSQSLLEHSLEAGEAWWPESMHRVKRELTQQYI